METKKRSWWQRVRVWCRWACFDETGYIRCWAFMVALFGSISLVAGTPFVLIDSIGGQDGQYRGYVVAVDDLTNLTWDSTVAFVKTSAQASKFDTVLCVTDPALRTVLFQAIATATPVLITFRNDLFLWRWECNGGESIVTAIEVLSTSTLPEHD